VVVGTKEGTHSGPFYPLRDSIQDSCLSWTPSHKKSRFLDLQLSSLHQIEKKVFTKENEESEDEVSTIHHVELS